MRKLIVIGALLTSACATGPDYRAPQTPASAATPFITAAPGVDAGAPLPDKWWALYDDPLLDRLITDALAANTDLRIAVANLARAQAVTSEANAGRLPATTTSANIAYGDNAGPGAPAAQNRQWSYTGQFAVAWEADLFGRVSRLVEASRADVAGMEAARDAVRTVVAAETARAYSNVCAAGEAIAIAKSSLTLADENLRIVTAQERAGAVSSFDRERAAAAAARTRAMLAPLDGQRRAALFELAALSGRTPAEAPAAVATCDRVPAPQASFPIGDGAALLRRRPDIREAERRLAADTARIGVATADLYPRVSLGGSLDYFRNDTVRGSDSSSFSLGPLISWSFPNTAVARARVKQAEAGTQGSLAAFDGKVLTALKETEQALAIYAGETARHEALMEAQQRGDHAARLADTQYRAGSIAYLDLLVTQRDLVDIRSELSNSTQRLAGARIDLFKALGGGWETP